MPTMHDYVESQMAGADPIALPLSVGAAPTIELVDTMRAQLMADRAEVFDLAYRYFHGDHLEPYAPQDRSDQIADLQARSITNWIPLLVNLPTQVSYVEGYRRGESTPQNPSPKSISVAGDRKRFSPEYACWQENRMDGKQATIYQAALLYGQSFVHVNTVHPSGKVKVDVLSTRNTVAFFDDPVNDLRPLLVLTIKTYARDENTPGLAILWDDTYRYELSLSDKDEFTFIGDPVPHGLSACPVIRYTCGAPDDEGRSLGVVNDTLIRLQDRVNQAAFSTNVTADFGAFKVRTAAGLQVNYKLNPDTGEPLLDGAGNPVPEPIAVSQAKMLISEDPTTKFGQLDETPLAGYLSNEDQATKNLAAIAQFPLHALIGNVSNLSAEALAALEQQFMRQMQSFQVSWGESHEELFRLLAEAKGDDAGAVSYGGEVRWRDMTSKAFGAVMDGLGKASQMLNVPSRGLWPLIPGLSSGDIADLEELAEEEQADAMLNGMTPVNAAARERRPASSAAGSARSPAAPATQPVVSTGVGGNPANQT